MFFKCLKSFGYFKIELLYLMKLLVENDYWRETEIATEDVVQNP